MCPAFIFSQQISGDIRYYFVHSYQLYQRISDMFIAINGNSTTSKELTLSYIESIIAMNNDWGGLYSDIVSKSYEVQKQIYSSTLSGTTETILKNDSKALYMLVPATYLYSTILSGLSSYFTNEKGIQPQNSTYIRIVGILNRTILEMWDTVAIEYGPFWKQ
jgi:hypothetical protein